MALARYQFTVTDEAGNVIPAASIEVRRESNGTIVPLFSDRAGVVSIGNPFSADSDGFAAFHCVGGAYQVVATSGAFSRTWRYVAIGRAQESDTLLTGIVWRFSTATTDSDPGLGNIKFNNAVLASVTTLYVDNVSDQGATITSWLDTLDDGGTTLDRGIIMLQTADATGMLIARITGSIVDGTGYRKITVTPITTAGAFALDAEVNAIFIRSPVNGVNAGLKFTFDSSTSMADPGAGDFRLNSGTLSAVTAIAVDDTSAETGNPDVSAVVLSWDDSLSAVRGTIVLQQITAPENIAVYSITGASTDNSGWTQLAVAHVASAGTFVNGEAYAMQFWRTGDRGTDGISPGLPFTFSSTTSMADPGAGIIRLNNATLSSVTAAAVDDQSAATGNPDVSLAVLSWDDSTQTANRGTLLIKKQSATENFAVYRITGASTDNSGWTQLALTYVAHAGSFTNADLLSIEFTRAADATATASETVEGAVEMATSAEIYSAATGAKALMAEDLETAAAAVAITSTSNLTALDWDAGIYRELTLGENTTISNPTNGQPGTYRTIYVIASSGTRTVSFGANFLGELPTITDVTTTKAYLLSIFCRSTSHFVVSSKRALG